MTPEEAATIIEGMARTAAQASSGPVIGAVGIGTPGGGPGIVGVATTDGSGRGTNIGFMAVATSGDAIASTSQTVTICNEIAKDLRSGNPDSTRLRSLLAQLAQIAPAIAQTVRSTLDLANVLT